MVQSRLKIWPRLDFFSHSPNPLMKRRSSRRLKPAFFIKRCPCHWFTGTGGAGKSSLLDELMLRIQRDNPGKKVCLLCVDPTRKRTGGALLGDRIRMNSLSNNDLYMRSLASRGSGSEIVRISIGPSTLQRRLDSTSSSVRQAESVKEAMPSLRLPITHST